jgi:uncharacterized protein YndB with AHSA1/START domain
VLEYVETEATIDAPLEDVASYAADPSHAPEWYENITSAEWETPPPLQQGSRIAFAANWMDRRLEYTYEVIDFVPNERLVMRTAQGPFPMETTYTWHPVGDGRTRMTLRNRAPEDSEARDAMRRANEKDLENLRSILERRQAKDETRSSS